MFIGSPTETATNPSGFTFRGLSPEFGYFFGKLRAHPRQTLPTEVHVDRASKRRREYTCVHMYIRASKSISSRSNRLRTRESLMPVSCKICFTSCMPPFLPHNTGTRKNNADKSASASNWVQLFADIPISILLVPCLQRLVQEASRMIQRMSKSMVHGF